MAQDPITTEEEEEEDTEEASDATLAAARLKKTPVRGQHVEVHSEDEEENDGDEKSPNWPPQAEGQLTVDVYQTPTDIVIQSTVGGVKPADVDITIANDMVSIKGSRKRAEEIPEDHFYYQECYWGAFSRTIILPAEVKGEDAEASLKDGLLTIRLPKAEKERVKKIPVRIQ